jgi:AcrR family transcriptional regulator
VASRRGEATKERLLDVAEQLFGEHGVFDVSLRQIRIDAGERNTDVMRYYFGDRNGLIVALADRHVTRIGARQQALWDEVVARHSEGDRRELAELLVRPSAEYVELGPSERSWVKIMAELDSRPDVRWHEVVKLTPSTAVDVGRELHKMMISTLTERIARERMFVGARMTVNVCADRARRIESPEVRGSVLPSEVFIDNLSNMLCGALFAPLTPAASKRRSASGQAGLRPDR